MKGPDPKFTLTTQREVDCALGEIRKEMPSATSDTVLSTFWRRYTIAPAARTEISVGASRFTTGDDTYPWKQHATRLSVELTDEERAAVDEAIRKAGPGEIVRVSGPRATIEETFCPLEDPEAYDNPRPKMTAADIAAKAADLVGGDRHNQHGDKADNFNRIATVWNAWLDIRKAKSAPLDAHDVACMMAMLKLARTQSGSLNLDDYVDAAGYSACAGDVAQS